MDYRVNPLVYAHMTALPADVIKRQLRLASAVQWRVLLWIFLHNGQPISAQSLCTETGLSAQDAEEALQYWVQDGVLCHVAEPSASHNTQQQPNAPSTPPVYEQWNPPADQGTSPNPPAKRPTVVRPVDKPTREETARRGSQSPEIGWMLTEVQSRFGRTLSTGEMSTLVWLHDNEGLPVPVILMIVEYAVTQEKRAMRYIEKIAVSWAEEEINTVEKAERRLKEMETAARSWKTVQTAFGIDYRKPSARETTLSMKWINEWRFSTEMLRLAYDYCVDATGKLSMPYINKVLEKWHAAGVRTPVDAAKQRLSHGSKTAATQKKKSYDLSDIHQLLKADLKGSDG